LVRHVSQNAVGDLQCIQKLFLTRIDSRVRLKQHHATWLIRHRNGESAA